MKYSSERAISFSFKAMSSSGFFPVTSKTWSALRLMILARACRLRYGVDRPAGRRNRRRVSRTRHGLPPRNGRARQISPALSGVRRTVQRIRYADRETNYCPGCQTAGRILADRSLSAAQRRLAPTSG